MADLKLVYAAPTEETALNVLELFKDKWDSKYPKIYKSWNDKMCIRDSTIRWLCKMRELPQKPDFKQSCSWAYPL